MVRSLFLSLAISAFLLTDFSQPIARAAPHVPSDGRMITARDLVQLGELDGLSISRDGGLAAFQVRRADPEHNRYELAWYVVALDAQSDARKVSDGGEPIFPLGAGRGAFGVPSALPPVWSPDGEWIAFLRQDGGRIQVWRARVRDGVSEQLTHNEGDARAIAYSRTGQQLFFETEPTDAQRARTLAPEAARGFLYDGRFAPTYSSLPVFMTAQEQAATRVVWTYDFASRRERLASPDERAEFDAIVARPDETAPSKSKPVLSPDGGKSWAEALDPTRQGFLPPLTIVAQPSTARAPIACSSLQCTSQRIEAIWWRNSSEVVFARRESASLQNTELYAWNPSNPAPRLILTTPNRFTDIAQQRRCAVARDHLICPYDAPNYPTRLVAIDLASGAITTLYDPNPTFAQFDLGAPAQRLDIRTASGVETFAYFVRPPQNSAAGRLPLVIVTYRCRGFLKGGIAGEEYPIYPFAAEGFAVLCLDIPTTDTARAAVMDWNSYQNWSRGADDPIKHRIQDAIDTAVAQLDRAGAVDPRRVSITGLSYGAETVQFALFNMPQLAAAVASGPGFEPSSLFLQGTRAPPLFRQWGLADSESPRWNALSLTRNVGRVRAPLLLNVPDREFITALEPFTALRSADRAVEMYVFENEYHNKWQPAHLLAIYKRNIDWMNFWLRGIESGLTQDPEQYTRWRTMREEQCRLFGPDGSQRHVRPRGHERMSDSDLVPWYCNTALMSEVRH